MRASRRRRNTRLEIVLPPLILAACGAFYAWFILRTSVRFGGTRYFTLFDDAMVSMRYARNLADGSGLVWNPGEAPVEGYTNFLWTLALAALHQAEIPEAQMGLAVAAVGAVVLAATALVARAVVLEIGASSALASTFAILGVATLYPLLYWTLRGLEVGVIALLTTAAILFALRIEQIGVAPLATVVALAMLTRDDAVVLCGVVALYAVATSARASRSPRALVLIGATAGTLLAHTAFRIAYYGEIAPNTYYLKLSGVGLLTRLERGGAALAETGVLTLVVPLALALAVLPNRSRYRGLSLLAGVFVASCTYSVYVGGDAFEMTQFANRFTTPGLVGLVVLAAVFLDSAVANRSGAAAITAAATIAAGCAFLLMADSDILDDGSPPAGARPVAVGLAAILLLGVLHVTARQRLRTVVAATVGACALLALNGRAYQAWWTDNAAFADDDGSMTRYGLVLRESTPQEATLAVTWAGAIPYFSHRRAVDLLGKSDAHVARLKPRRIAFRPGHTKWSYEYSIARLRPELVAQIFDGSRSTSTALVQWGYEPLAGLAWVRRDAIGIDRGRIARFLVREFGAPSRSVPISRPNSD